jgi:hypothetical protein
LHEQQYPEGQAVSESLSYRAASRPSTTLPPAGAYPDLSRRTEVLRLFHAGLSRWEIEIRLGIGQGAIDQIIDGKGRKS